MSTTPPAGAAMPAAVLWDMDGTLIDTEPYWFAAEADVVDRHGNGVWPDELAEQVVGFDLLDSAEFIRRHGQVDLPPDRIVEELLDGVIARIRHRIPWRPGARELLADLVAAGVPCALVTMSWRRFVDPVVAALPSGSFVATIVGDEVPEGKPSPVPYQLGARACGAAPQDCVAIEDSPTGVRSAVAAGCRVIGVPNVRDLDDADGVVVVRSLEHVTADSIGALSTATASSASPPETSSPRSRPPRRVAAGRRTVWLGMLTAATVAVTGLALTRGGDPGADLPPGAIEIHTWAPYWTLGDTVDEIERRSASLTEVSPFWFDTVGVDSVVANDNTSAGLADTFVEIVDGSSARVVPSILDTLPAGAMAAILSDPASRTRHVTTIVEFADTVDADGIDIDYEQFAFADGRDTWDDTRPAWVSFIEELGQALRSTGRTLTVSIPPVYVESDTGDRGYWVYDHGAIAEHVDSLRIMAYDYSVPEAGPISPLRWVRQSIDGVSAAVDVEHHHKLVLGVPSYGSNWVVSTVGDCPDTAEGRTNVTARTVDELAKRRNATPAYDPVEGEWSFSYALEVRDGAMSCIQNRQVFWVDAEGVAARTTLAREAGWGGVALWALGYEDDDVWDALVEAAVGTDTDGAATPAP